MKLLGASGRTFEPVEFVLSDRLCVPAWARALGSTDPHMRDLAAATAAGWSGRPVPPVMYAFFLTLPDEVLLGELGFTWGRTLAAGITVDVARVATDSERVQGRSYVDAAYEKVGRDGKARQFLRLRTDFVDDREQLVNRWQTMFIEHVPQLTPGLDAADPAPELGPIPAALPVHPVPPSSGAELNAHRVGPLDRLDFARVSVALDDPNLVHLDDEVARAAGFESVIGSGAFVLGSIYELARRAVGPERVTRLTMQQRRPFVVGAELVTTGTQAEGAPSSIEVTVALASGEAIGGGVATVMS